MTHQFLAPSMAHLWGKPGGCRAAPMLQAQHPEREESEAAREGTAAHEPAASFAAATLKGQRPDPAQWLGKKASNGVIYTQEMIDGAEVYADDIRAEAIARGVFGGDAIGVEQSVMLPRIHPLNGGTPDFWMHDKRNMALLLWDYKFGFRDVDAFENWQLMNYAALVLDHLGINGATEQGYTVVLKVVQPRSFKRGGPVDTWTVKATDLRPYWNDLAHGATEATALDAPARPGSHCLDCSARHACPALRKAAGAAMQHAQSVTAEQLDDMALSLEMGWLSDAKDLIEARLSGLQEETQERIRQGAVVPGWSAQPRYGRATWTDRQQVLNIGTAYGIDLRKDEPVTPNQAKEKGLPEDVVKHFSYRPETGFKLSRVKTNDAKKVFTQ